VLMAIRLTSSASAVSRMRRRLRRVRADADLESAAWRRSFGRRGTLSDALLRSQLMAVAVASQMPTGWMEVSRISSASARRASSEA
jgi:hypothetical protein